MRRSMTRLVVMACGVGLGAGVVWLPPVLAVADPTPGQPTPSSPTPAPAPTPAPKQTVPAPVSAPGTATPTTPSIPASKEPTLKPGMAPPALDVESWLKGDEVKKFEPGKVYVVWFWATWSRLSNKSVQHFSELKKVNDGLLEVVAVAAAERFEKNGADKRLENLMTFMVKAGPFMDYPVAYDGRGKAMRDWMIPAGQDGLPTAFIIGADTKITWIGPSMDQLFETSLEMAISDAKQKQAQPQTQTKTGAGAGAGAAAPKQ